MTDQGESLDQPSASPRQLSKSEASRLAQLPLSGICREYPNKIAHVLEGDADVAPPRKLHPAFYGCFDWHSAVHAHWTLVRLLKTFPDLPAEKSIREKLDNNLDSEKIQSEIAYFKPAGRQSFERPYGWAWLLKLAEELNNWSDPQAAKWAAALRPLASLIENLFCEFLPEQTYPVRSGAHLNTAFALSLAWDYADTQDRPNLKTSIEQNAKRYYLSDTNYPAHYEPSGTDFLSPCLEEANLMQRILDTDSFTNWFDAYLPQIPQALATPALVSNRSDGQLIHLDGLNLSRSWCYTAISKKLKPDHPKRTKLQQLASRHLDDALPNVVSGNYEGEHWLATFAIYALAN